MGFIPVSSLWRVISVKIRTLIQNFDEVGQLLHEVGHLLHEVGHLVYEVGLLYEVGHLLYEVGHLVYEVGLLYEVGHLLYEVGQFMKWTNHNRESRTGTRQPSIAGLGMCLITSRTESQRWHLQ